VADNPYTTSNPIPSASQGGSGGIYIGVAAGSDLETSGFPATKRGPFGVPMYKLSRKPLYKVGYQNSKQFSRELNNMDPNVIFLYQQRLNASGLLDKFTPGKLDKATRGAFKELLTQANQTGATWQSTLQDIETVGGMVGADGGAGASRERAPFVAQLDDPATLRAAFQQTAQSLYGGDLPDGEVQAMVDAYRSIQMSKQKAAYDAADTGGTIESEPNASAFAEQQIREKHPDQVARVEFNGTLSAALKALATTGGGLM
jgi:hypothetical protein